MAQREWRGSPSGGAVGSGRPGPWNRLRDSRGLGFLSSRAQMGLSLRHVWRDILSGLEAKKLKWPSGRLYKDTGFHQVRDSPGGWEGF